MWCCCLVIWLPKWLHPSWYHLKLTNECVLGCENKCDYANETLECDTHDRHALLKPHHTTIVIQTIFKLSVMENVEYMLQNLYVYFSHNLKKTQKFIELVGIVETKGQCIVRNILRCDGFQCYSLLRVLSEYKSLLLKIHQCSSVNNQVTHNWTCFTTCR
jgi:hypothetical protein